MGAIMEIPVPRTVEGACRLGRAINAQFRAERWAARRRWASILALAVGLVLAADNTMRFLPGGFRRILVASWWTVLGATILAVIVEVWATARMEHALDEAADV
jgi:hypothetical protein